MRIILTIVLLTIAKYAISSDKDFDMIVCNAISDNSERLECIRRVEEERALLKESEKRNREVLESSKRQKELDQIFNSCNQSFNCYAKSFVDSFGVLESKIFHACNDYIQSHAKYDYKWTDGYSNPRYNDIYRPKDNSRFNRYTVGFGGNSVSFMNGFGAWIPHSYICWYDALNNKVEVTVVEGRQ